jgi:hypothetical protein
LFKNSSGVFFTKALFFETSPGDRTNVVYTLKTEDHEGFPSLKRLYMESNDPSGYVCATRFLGGWEHWLKLRECPWFMDHLSVWEQELEVKLRAEALNRLMVVATNPESKAFLEVNKLLLNKGWLTPEDRAAMLVSAQREGKVDKRKVGRPSKDEIKREAFALFEKANEIDDDFERLVTGGKAN